MMTEDKQRRLEEAKQRFLATMRELLTPEDLKAIAEQARKAHHEDFPEDFPPAADRDRGGRP